MLSPVAAQAVGSSGRFSHTGADDIWSQAVGQSGEADEEQALTDATTKSRSGRYLLTCLIGYSMSFIVFGSQVSILGPTIAGLAERLQVDEPDLSPLFTALGVSCIVSGTPSGWLVDRMPTHHVLIGSLLVEAIGFSLVPLMPSVWSLTTLYFVVCFSYNFTNSAVFTSLAWMFPKRAGPGINLVLAMFGLGSFFIPLAAQGCKMYFGSSLSVFYLVGALALAAAVPFLFVQSPTPPSGSGGGGGGHGARHHASRTLENVTTVAVVVLVFFTTAAETAIGSWIYTFSMKEVGTTDVQAALGNSAFWGAFTVGRVIGAAISHATTPLVLLLGSVPFSIIGCALPLLVGRAGLSHTLVMVVAALTGLGNSTGYANAVALLERYVPVTGFINGVFGAVAGGACMVGPVLVATLAKHTELRYMSMPWVGLVLYSLHIPAILTAVAAGTKLLKLPLVPASEPFLPPATAPAAGGSANGTAAAGPAGDGYQSPALVVGDGAGHAAKDGQPAHQ